MANYDLGTIGYTIENTGGQKSIAELKQMAEAGLEAHRNTNQLTQSGAKLTQYFASVDKQLTAVNRNMQNHNRYLSQAAQGSNRFGVVTQQAGYQIGDFLVQVQSGTNWMVAFGQQATQLVGILPLMGAGFMGLSTGALVALSAGLGIAIPLVTAIGAAFMRTSDEAKTGADGVNTYATALKGLQETLRETQVEIDKLSFGTEDPVMASALKALREAEANLEIARANQRRVGDTLAPTSEQASALREAVIAYNDMARLVRELEEKQQSLSEAQRMLNGHLSTAAGTQARLASEKQAELQAARELQAATANAHQVYARTRMEANKLADETVRAGLAASDLSLVDFGNISAGAAAALTMAGNLGIAYQEAVALGGMLDRLTAGSDERGSQRKTVRGANTRMPEQPWLKTYNRGGWLGSVGGAGGGGGGGAGDARIISLIESLQTEREVIEEWYAESQTILQTASDAELAIIGGRNEARLRLEQEYQEKLRGIRNAGNAGALGDAEIFFQGMADIAAAGGDRTVKAMRIFSAAQALINSYVAFTEVLKDPSFIGRPWARFGAAASALSSGLAAVAAIKGGGGGSISRGSATVASPSAAAPSPQTVYIDSLEPDSLYSGQTLINLFDAFYNENDKRGKVFVVAR